MIQDKEEWDYLATSSEVWFEDLKPNIIYKFSLTSWFAELNEQYPQSKRDIKINAISIGNQKLEKKKEIKDGERIILSLWRAFYDKWERALKSNIIEEKPVIIELSKTTERKWFIFSIKGVDD